MRCARMLVTGGLVLAAVGCIRAPEAPVVQEPPSADSTGAWDEANNSSARPSASAPVAAHAAAPSPAKHVPDGTPTRASH